MWSSTSTTCIEELMLNRTDSVIL
uniref:Uncharacterized protein n=1 Tax=Rhizophora mucronata TaxID=61149 RepID=A0A2P2NI92_RHIMU